MTTSNLSASEPSFDRLHEKVRRWIWRKGWSELRDVQERTIRAVLDGDGDVLVIAGTSSGKTEAAFLPILSRVADREEEGLSVLYVSPLKALINDQFGRLEDLCEDLGINVVKWHGDAPQAAKLAVAKNPSGVALITPESIEAMLVRRPDRARSLYAHVDFVVVDELHAFLSSVRGLHLRSLLDRVCLISGRRPRFVGLSATIGDPSAAMAWMNPGRPDAVVLVDSSAGNPELRLQIKAFVDDDALVDPDRLEVDGEDGSSGASGQAASKIALDHIADHLFKTLRGSNNLVFAGSRRRVEALADRLRRRCEKAAIPNEFMAHHGSLSKEMREPLEKRLKEGKLPTTAVATTTLELGIDIGSVVSVAQVGAPRSMSSLRQRLGRSGRREGMPSILRIYVREFKASAKTHPLDRLRLSVVASVASVGLLVRRYVESAAGSDAVASVVVQQVLSVVAERDGATAAELYATICGSGPLARLDRREFVSLLRHMGREAGLVEQMADGSIGLAPLGERIVRSRDFFAMFETDEEWRVVSGGKMIGTLPLMNPAKEGGHIAFAGQRWRILSVDVAGRIMEVVKDRAAKMPAFEALGREELSDEFVAAMRDVLRDREIPAFADATARELLAEGRGVFAIHGLDGKALWEEGGGVQVMTWKGTATNRMLALLLKHLGYDAGAHDIGVSVMGVSARTARSVLAALAATPPALSSLVMGVQDLQKAKYDEFVPHDVLASQWEKANARAHAGALAIARELALTSDVTSDGTDF